MVTEKDQGNHSALSVLSIGHFLYFLRTLSLCLGPTDDGSRTHETKQHFVAAHGSFVLDTHGPLAQEVIDPTKASSNFGSVATLDQ